jgi:hypothetical protein
MSVGPGLQGSGESSQADVDRPFSRRLSLVRRIAELCGAPSWACRGQRHGWCSPIVIGPSLESGCQHMHNSSFVSFVNLSVSCARIRAAIIRSLGSA